MLFLCTPMLYSAHNIVNGWCKTVVNIYKQNKHFIRILVIFHQLSVYILHVNTSMLEIHFMILDQVVSLYTLFPRNAHVLSHPSTYWASQVSPHIKICEYYIIMIYLQRNHAASISKISARHVTPHATHQLMLGES